MKVKGKLKSEFEMTDLGELSFFLGMEFVKLMKRMVMHQQKYICETSNTEIDNKSAISLAMNPISQGRSKHIETRFHFIREQVTNGMIEV
jgi:hypothetical protein